MLMICFITIHNQHRIIEPQTLKPTCRKGASLVCGQKRMNNRLFLEMIGAGQWGVYSEEFTPAEHLAVGQIPHPPNLPSSANLT